MHYPRAEVTVNGTPVTGAFYSRLISLKVADHAGFDSDAVEIEVEDGNPFLEIPERGDDIRVSLGYEDSGVVHMGSFIVDSVEVECLPYGIRISGKSADVRKEMKGRKERHWDGVTCVIKTVIKSACYDFKRGASAPLLISDTKHAITTCYSRSRRLAAVPLRIRIRNACAWVYA